MRSKTVITFFLLLALAGSMRFYNLGEWSRDLDEGFTIIETKLLTGEIPVTEDTNPQYYKLPQMIFASYYVHYLGYKLFGEDEFGARVLPAVMGTLNVGIVFLLAVPLFGFTTALTLALLLCSSPEHLLRSQVNRFYIQPFFLSSVVFLLGAYCIKFRSPAAALWIAPLVVLTVLSHSLCGVIWGIILTGITAEYLLERFGKTRDSREYSKEYCKEGHRKKYGSSLSKICLILILTSLTLLAVAWFHIRPLAAGWNSSGSWGYSPLHNVMSFVNNAGIPLVLLAATGILLLLFRPFRTEGSIYWVLSCVLCIITAAVFPLKIVWNPAYNFLFSFPLFVCAASFSGEVCSLITQRTESRFAKRVIGTAWIAAAVLLPFPSIASYYIDGSRLDDRSAFRYVQEHWHSGDRLTGYTMGNAAYYAPGCKPAFPLGSAPVKQLDCLIKESSKPLWIVLESHRGGLDDNLRCWLSRNAVFEAKFSKKRLDYTENTVEVWYCPKP